MRLSQHLEGIALVSESVAITAEAVTDNLRRFGPTERRGIKDWAECKEYLLPLKSFPTRYALLPVDGWTVVLTDQWNEAAYVDVLGISMRTRCTAVGGTFSEESRSFHLARDGKEVRHIVCYEDDGRWTFHAEGPAQLWEVEVNYRRRRTRDRLTPDVVLAYLNKVTGISMPLRWNEISEEGVGLARSTRDVQVPIETYDVVEDA